MQRHFHFHFDDKLVGHVPDARLSDAPQESAGGQINVVGLGHKVAHGGFRVDHDAADPLSQAADSLHASCADGHQSPPSGAVSVPELPSPALQVHAGIHAAGVAVDGNHLLFLRHDTHAGLGQHRALVGDRHLVKVVHRQQASAVVAVVNALEVHNYRLEGDLHRQFATAVFVVPGVARFPHARQESQHRCFDGVALGDEVRYARLGGDVQPLDTLSQLADGIGPGRPVCQQLTLGQALMADRILSQCRRPRQDRRAQQKFDNVSHVQFS